MHDQSAVHLMTTSSQLHSMKDVCYRMEDHDCTKRFKNKMRMVIEAPKIQFEKVRRNGKWMKQSVDMELSSASSFRVDWSPVEASWGQAVLQLSNQNGASGLIEDHVMFWKAADQSRACALADPRCFCETHDFDSKG